MRKFAVLLALAAMSLTAGASQALDLTADNVSVNAGSAVAVNVIWSSTTALKYLTTQFLLTAVGSAPAGEAYFSNTPDTQNPGSGTPAMPPLADINYLFAGDSDDFLTQPAVNPASVFTSSGGPAYDTYSMADSTKTGTDYAQSGTRLWTILNISTTGLAAGQYQISLDSANSVFDTTAQTGQTPTYTGGLITINAVPEPSTYAFAAIASVVVAGVARRKRK